MFSSSMLIRRRISAKGRVVVQIKAAWNSGRGTTTSVVITQGTPEKVMLSSIIAMEDPRANRDLASLKLVSLSLLVLSCDEARRFQKKQ